jgi:hypothetical protein
MGMIMLWNEIMKYAKEYIICISVEILRFMIYILENCCR